MQKTNKLHLLIVYSLCVLFVISCDGNRLYDKNYELPESGWSIEDTKTFTFNVVDTNSKYNVLINVRNTSNYAYRNLYLFIEMISPSNKFFQDTIPFELADNQGKWIGSGMGNIFQNQLPLLQGVEFLESGEYKVKIVHGMRNDTLKSISDVGVRVERSYE